MKVIGLTGLVFLIAFYLTSTVTYGQSLATETYSKGVEYAAQGKFNEAKEQFEKALKNDPLFNPAKLSLVTIKDVIENKLNNEEAIYFFKGLSSVNNGLYDHAIIQFKKAIKINSAYADFYYERGNAYSRIGQKNNAIKSYYMAIKINPRHAEAFNNRGIIWASRGDYRGAIRDYDKAIEINPEDSDALSNRGHAFTALGQYDRAISDLSKAIDINPAFAKAYHNRGNAYIDKGENDKAIKDYTSAIAINPNLAKSYDNRGFAYFVNMGNKAKGCADWKKACNLGECNNYNTAKQKGKCM